MKKILIVEDNNDFREILHRFITKLGYHTIKARNSKEAIECAEAEQPDLIFMDLDLPDADGIKTTAILRQNPKTSHIPVVAITAWISALWQEEAEKVGIATDLIKPISPRAIRVRAVMRVFHTLKETIEEYTQGALTRGEV
jgi:CheY-like chemotaxis protein